MNSSELNEAFRSGLGVEVSNLFSDHDVWRMANDAYRMFVRLTGGIPDFTSTATKVSLVAGEAVSALDPVILRIDRMTRTSDNGEVKVINYTDVGSVSISDYGRSRPLVMDDRQGVVRYGVVGMEKNKIRWISVPEVNDTVDMIIHRLPVTKITKDGQDLTEVEEQHHLALLQHMNALASATPLVGNPQAAGAYESAFTAYCAKVKSEMARYKAKPARVVRYGGLP